MPNIWRQLFSSSFIESLGWKCPWRSPGFTSCGRVSIVDQAAHGPYNLAFNTFRDGVYTASLGRLCWCLTSLSSKKLSLTSNLKLPSFSFKPFLFVLSRLPKHHKGEKCVYILDYILINNKDSLSSSGKNVMYKNYYKGSILIPSAFRIQMLECLINLN